MRIVFFDIDCLRPDHLGCYGYHRPTSPNIDKVAAQGVRFSQYHCATSPCLPSRTEWASGRFGTRNGVVSNHSAGARFHIRKQFYVGPEPDNDMLMRRLRTVGCEPVSFSNFADRHNAWWFMCGWKEFHTPNLKGGFETAEEVNNDVIRWLECNATRDNYLLHINYWDTHRPYRMDARWAERFADYPVAQSWPDEHAIRDHQSVEGWFTAQGQFQDGKSPFPLMPGSISNRADFEHMLTGYDASIAYVDYHLGMVMKELERQGVLDDTAIIVSSDHGDSFGEHGIYSDHVCADASIHHIPLIVKWPGVAAVGKACDLLLYNVDLSATLCDLLGAEVPSDWDGVSFAPQLQGQAGIERGYLVWTHSLYAVQRAVRTRDHLMIKTFDDFGYRFRETELYDLANDPYETTDIAADQPDVVRRHEVLLETWLDEQQAKPHGITDPVEAVLFERGVEGVSS